MVGMDVLDSVLNGNAVDDMRRLGEIVRGCDVDGSSIACTRDCNCVGLKVTDCALPDVLELRKYNGALSSNDMEGEVLNWGK